MVMEAIYGYTTYGLGLLFYKDWIDECPLHGDMVSIHESCDAEFLEE